MRARLALLSANLTVELREVVLKDKAPEFLAASPSGTVPCLLKKDGAVFDESLDIMLWALEQSDPEGLLAPTQSGLDAMRDLIDVCDGPFKHHLDRYKYDTRYDDANREEERAAASAFLLKLNDCLSDQMYLFGDRASLADFAILPFVRQFANTDREWFESQDWKPLLKWLTAFETSGRFLSIMTKYPKWQAGDPPVLFAAP